MIFKNCKEVFELGRGRGQAYVLLENVAKIFPHLRVKLRPLFLVKVNMALASTSLLQLSGRAAGLASNQKIIESFPIFPEGRWGGGSVHGLSCWEHLHFCFHVWQLKCVNLFSGRSLTLVLGCESRAWVNDLLEKTANISRLHRWFQRQMSSEERVQGFHTDDVLLTRSGQCL